MPPLKSCLNRGHPSSEVTDAICRVPSTSFSQAPWYALPAYLCWFRVRSCWQGYFQEHLHCLIQSNKKRQFTAFVTTARSRNINRVPIDYGFRPRLRGRLTLRGLTLRRKPWTFGDRVSHSVYRYSCQHSHFRSLHRMPYSPASSKALYPALPLRYLSAMSCAFVLQRQKRTSAMSHYAPLPCTMCILSFGSWLEPRYIFAAGQLI